MRWSLALFVLLLFTLGYYPSFTMIGLENFFHLIGYYVQFLNPISRMDFLESFDSTINYGNNPFFNFFFFLNKIIVGIGIFEMIRSFRKFVIN